MRQTFKFSSGSQRRDCSRRLVLINLASGFAPNWWPVIGLKHATLQYRQVQGSRYNMQVMLHSARHLVAISESQDDQYKSGQSVPPRTISASQADHGIRNQALPLLCPRPDYEFTIHLDVHREISAVVNYLLVGSIAMPSTKHQSVMQHVLAYL